MNKLKQLIRISAFLLGMAGVTACSQDERLLPDETGNNMRLCIHVSDSGFTGKEAENTRASDNSYVTAFTSGDKIGLYAVKDGRITHTNICVTLDGSGVWKLPTEVILYDIPGTVYYAYYPYRSTLSGTVNPQAGNADAFYADIINNWDVNTDQSTYALYTAQDLMVGNGAVSGGSGPNTKTLSFSLSHKMALAVINPPKVKYTFLNTVPSVPEYSVSAQGLAFTGFSPWQADAETYRYLVKPGGLSNLTGTYRKDGVLKEFVMDASGILSGNYKMYNVDGGTTQREHTLAVGDFLLKDGSLLAGNSTLTSEQKVQVAGIVYWVGDACSPNPGSSFSGVNYDKLLVRDHSGCTHGLVVSLSEVKSVWYGNSYDYFIDVSGWFESNKDRYPDYQSPYGWGTVSMSALGNTILGYNNTRVLSAFNSSHPSTQVLTDAFVYLGGLPSVSVGSGWYIPSVKELSLMCSGDYSGDIWSIENDISQEDLLKIRNLLNVQLSKVGGVSLGAFSYWSSSEYDSNYAFDVYFSNGIVSGYTKASSCAVRGVLAF